MKKVDWLPATPHTEASAGSKSWGIPGYAGWIMNMLLSSLLLFGCSLQDKLLYYPDARTPSAAELARNGLQFWPSGPDGYRGFLGDIPHGDAKGTVVVLHGNAATAADRTYYLEPLHRLGFRVLLAEYPGYGGRKGKLGEESFVRDTRETIHLVADKYPGPLYILGESLGGAVAASALKTNDARVTGLVLITPWATLEELAREIYPWLPVRLFMTDPFDTVSNLNSFPGPIAIVAAERDTIIPPIHAERLYQSVGGVKKFWTIARGDHNDWPYFITPGTWAEIMMFVAAGGKPDEPAK